MNWPDLIPEAQNIMVISTATVREAEKSVESCEHCSSNGVEIPFDWILDCVTACDSTTTDYILEAPAKCPSCQRPIFEKTPVEPAD